MRQSPAFVPPSASDDVVAAWRRLMTSRVAVLELRRRVEERRPRRYRAAINDAIRLMAEGVCSALEELFVVDVEIAHALPTACRQTPFAVDGRTLLGRRDI